VQVQIKGPTSKKRPAQKGYHRKALDKYIGTGTGGVPVPRYRF
jgi:hypothetical protein